MPPAPHVLETGPKHCAEVDTGVQVEVLVLNGDHRVLHRFGDVVEIHQTPVLDVAEQVDDPAVGVVDVRADGQLVETHVLGQVHFNRSGLPRLQHVGRRGARPRTRWRPRPAPAWAMSTASRNRWDSHLRKSFTRPPTLPAEQETVGAHYRLLGGGTSALSRSRPAWCGPS